MVTEWKREQAINDLTVYVKKLQPLVEFPESHTMMIYIKIFNKKKNTWYLLVENHKSIYSPYTARSSI